MARTSTVNRVTRRKVPRHVREQDMLRVAERAFAERGFHGASVDAIAEGAGISKPMVYAYFESKEGLYRGVMQRARASLLQRIAAVADEDSAPDERLWHGLLAFFTFVAEERDAWTVLLSEVTTGTGPFAAEGDDVRRRIAALVSVLLREQAEAEGLGADRLAMIEPLARALIGSAESLAVWWGEHPDHTAEQVAGILMNFAWSGLGELVKGRVWTPSSPA
jgi:AcrR family transcriptional regulator